MLKKIIKISALALTLVILIFMTANTAGAAGFIKDDTKKIIDQGVKNLGDTAGYETGHSADALLLVQTVINIFLSVIGVLLLVYILYAGYNWLTARGEEEKVTKAKETLKRAIVGAIIIIAAYAISVFVISRLEQGTLNGGGGGVGGYPSKP